MELGSREGKGLVEVTELIVGQNQDENSGLCNS